jgi:hypothetical protein
MSELALHAAILNHPSPPTPLPQGERGVLLFFVSSVFLGVLCVTCLILLVISFVREPLP